MKKLWIICAVLLAVLLFGTGAAAQSENPALQTPRDFTSHEDYEAWVNSAAGRWYFWKHPQETDDSPRFDRAFRQFYAADPELTIVDHIVYLQTEMTVRENKKWVKRPCYCIVDYFDTDAAEAAATKLVLPREVNGLPVWDIFMRHVSQWSAGVSDGGFTNDTVETVVLKDGWTAVPDYAFSNFSALKKVGLPASVQTVGLSAFQNCRSLKKIVGCKGLTHLRSSAFAGCESLASFPRMAELKTVEGGAFSGCAFKTLTLSGDAFIGGGDEDHYAYGGTFSNCKQLKSVTFTDCSKKNRRFTVEQGLFRGCTALKTVTLPKKCKDIEIMHWAFEGCKALTGVENTDRVTEIHRRAFANCTSLRRFKVGPALVFAKWDAFFGCTGLERFELYAKDPSVLGKNEEIGGMSFTDGRDEDGNFIQCLSKNCIVLVKTRAMKAAVKATGFKGAVRIWASVETPQAFTSRVNNDGTVTFLWDPVKKATGYRLYIYSAEKDRWVPLKTTKKTSVTITPPQPRAGYVVRAYRIIDGDTSWSGYSDYAKLRLDR